MRIRYNSPVVLTFALIALAIQAADSSSGGRITVAYFAAPPRFSLLSPLDWFRLFSHVLGHAGWSHLLANLLYLLMLGPLLEEKYGAGPLLLLMGLTALTTGLINALLFSSGLLGASGIVFMLIVLGSIVDVKRGDIPLTFVLVALLFIGTEVVNACRSDSISQTAHLAGGALGALFGFRFARQRRGRGSPSAVA